MITTLPVVTTPVGVAVNSAGTRVYVTNTNRGSPKNGSVSVIDTSNNTEVAIIAVLRGPAGVAVNPAGTRVYVANTGSSRVSVIDTISNTVVSTIQVPADSFGVAVNPAGTLAYVANNGSNNVSAIDTSINTVVATVPVGHSWALGNFIGAVPACLGGTPPPLSRPTPTPRTHPIFPPAPVIAITSDFGG